jgi:hypothetical protein
MGQSSRTEMRMRRCSTASVTVPREADGAAECGDSSPCRAAMRREFMRASGCKLISLASCKHRGLVSKLAPRHCTLPEGNESNESVSGQAQTCQ